MLVVLTMASAVPAQPATPVTGGGGPQVRWATVDAGQAVLAAGGLRLSATVGQPDVPVGPVLAGGSYRLRAGYWLTPAASADRIFADGFDPPT
jgi:hypothetical protein